MQEVRQALKIARPKLSTVAPLTAAICWGYVVVNLVLGLGMIFIYQGTIAPISIAAIFSYPVWGALFLLTSALTCYGLISNNWNISKQSQLLGLGLKSVWAIALIIRCFSYPQTILITGVWIFFAYIQAVTYIHFLPIPKGVNHESNRTIN